MNRTRVPSAWLRARLSRVGVSLLLGCALILACRAVGDTLEGVGDATGIDAIKKLGRAISSYQDLSPSEEHYVGRSVSADVVSRYAIEKSTGLADYLERIGQSLVHLNPQVRPTFRGYRFCLLESDLVQAVSAPAGFVFVSRGSIARAQSEDEVAAILAHEIAHVHLKHALQAIQKARLVSAGQSLAQLASDELNKTQHLGDAGKALAGSVQDISGTLIDRGYSRGFEQEADRMAVEILRGAGYPPEALAAYLDRLGKEGGSGGWFATHPAPTDRIESLKLSTQVPANVGSNERAQRFKIVTGR